MKLVNNQLALLFLVVVWVLALGCTDVNRPTTVTTKQTIPGDATEVEFVLKDGVYPVVQDDDTVPPDNQQFDVVQLDVVPVAGSELSKPETIRVVVQPIVLLRNVPSFEFKFENNECTEIGFSNTEQLKAYTRDHVGSKLAVVIDNQVISHHKIREPIDTDQVRITCCTVGGGDHLHKHLQQLKLGAANQE